MGYLKIFSAIALFFLVAFAASSAMANDFVVAPHGPVVELNAGMSTNDIGQNNEAQMDVSSSSSHANSAVIDELRQLNEMARQSSQNEAGW